MILSFLVLFLSACTFAVAIRTIALDPSEPILVVAGVVLIMGALMLFDTAVKIWE